jgi:hypothetical protein
MEKRGDISPESTPQKEVPPTDRSTTAARGATRQAPAPPPLLKKGESATDEHPTAAELRESLADSPQKRMADRVADRLKP